jgi:iron(III) transport system permease protein
VKYLSFGIKTTGDGFRQIDDVLAEASRVAGANWTQTMAKIWLPLLKPSLVAAFFLVFMPVLSELTMTVILSGPGLETIGTLIFQLQEYADASGGGASVLALLIVLIVLFINESVKRLSRGRYGL